MLFDKTQPVYILAHKSTEPAYNLACEEYFLCRTGLNLLLLWRNRPSVIIGRNQNAYAELNMDYVHDNALPVIRRLSGGGAVYHDLGNLNYTYILDDSCGFSGFAPYLQPVADYLRSLGLDAALSGRNDILVNALKVSGNAQAHHKGRTLIHGTLLFDARLDVLAKALSPHAMKLKNKGITSVASRVANIQNLLPGPMDIEVFTEGLRIWFANRENCVVKEISASENAEILQLATDKYSTWEWNIGQSPAYSAEASSYLPGGMVSVHFDVRDGTITRLKIFGDFFGSREIAQLEQRLTGIKHEETALGRAVDEAELEQYIMGVSAQEFTRLFFAQH